MDLGVDEAVEQILDFYGMQEVSGRRVKCCRIGLEELGTNHGGRLRRPERLEC